MKKSNKYTIAYYIVLFLTGIFFMVIGYDILTWQCCLGYILVFIAALCGFNMREKEEYLLDYNTENKLYESHNETIRTVYASCISRKMDISESDEEIMIKECLCKELAKQLLPYINYEKYPIVDKYNDEEIKYVGTIKIIS